MFTQNVPGHMCFQLSNDMTCSLGLRCLPFGRFCPFLSWSLIHPLSFSFSFFFLILLFLISFFFFRRWSAKRSRQLKAKRKLIRIAEREVLLPLHPPDRHSAFPRHQADRLGMKMTDVGREDVCSLLSLVFDCSVSQSSRSSFSSSSATTTRRSRPIGYGNDREVKEKRSRRMWAIIIIHSNCRKRSGGCPR